MFLQTLLTILTIILMACASNAKVFEGPGGLNQVVAEHSFSDNSSRLAMEAAFRHCQKQGKRVVWGGKSQSYQSNAQNIQTKTQDILDYEGHIKTSMDFRCEPNY